MKLSNMKKIILIWKNIKTWKKGLIIGLIPLVLVIILTLILITRPPVGLVYVVLIMFLPFFYLFSFIFLFFAVLIASILHKSWKIKGLVILIIILVFALTIIYAYSGSPPSGEVEIYKGIWSPVFPMTAKMLLLDIGQLKEDGVNTLSFGPNYMTDDEGNIGKFPNWLTILFIQSAHRNGFRVFLVPDMWGPGFTGVENKTLFFEQATNIVLEWAEIAEKYGVEMYAPSNEPAIIIDDKEAVNQWAHDVAVKIRERYSGILVYKASIADWGFDNDYRGYDYVGLDIFPHDPKQSLEEFKTELQDQIRDGLKFAERDGAKGVILSEIGVQVKIMIGAEDVSSTTREPFSLEFQKQAYEIFFEEGKDKVKGYVFCCWEPEFGPNNVPAEQVMKKWFNKLE